MDTQDLLEKLATAQEQLAAYKVKMESFRLHLKMIADGMDENNPSRTMLIHLLEMPKYQP